MRQTLTSASYIRNFIFGVEDSLVSTVGLLSGISIAEMDKKNIIITGAILILVEAFSMAVGSFLSESSAENYMKQAEFSTCQSSVSGIIMFFSYLFSGLIPLFPYLVWSPETALGISVGFSLLSLFFLGVWSAKISRVNYFKSGLRMLILGGIAISVGVFFGRMVNTL